MLMWIVTPRRSPRRSPEGRIKPLNRNRRQDVFALRNEILFYELWFANCDAYRAGGRQLCQEQGIELDPASGPADHTRKRDATLLLPLRKKMSKNNSPSRRNHDKQMSGRADP